MRSLFCCLIVSAVVFSARAAEEVRNLTLDEFRDKMKGAWVGQLAGVTYGMPTEFKFTKPGAKLMPEMLVPNWKDEMINTAFDQDDLYVDLTFLASLDRHGVDVTPRQAGIDFANTTYFLWAANREGRINLRKGIAPPDCGHPDFSTRTDDIDYQIEADYSGIVAPGLPQAAVDFGRTFGRLVCYGDGLYAGQFVGAMYAEAYFTTNVREIVVRALKAIPSESQYAEMVRDMLAWHEAHPDDPVRVRGLAVDKYLLDRNYQRRSNGAIDCKINGAMILLGLLWGGGDFEKTIVLSMRGGFDSDCNPSSAAGVLGAACGLSRLPPKFGRLLRDDTVFMSTPYDVPGVYAASERVARAVVKRYGGDVVATTDGEAFRIPVRATVPDAYHPSWAAEPCAKSRYTAEEMSRQKYAIGPSDRFFEGWTVAGCAPKYLANWKHLDYAWETVPASRSDDVVLTHETRLPVGDPRLVIDVGTEDKDMFRLVVRVNGEVLFETVERTVWGWNSKLTLSLAKWAGKDVKIELVTSPCTMGTGRAYWHELAVRGVMAADAAE